MEFEILNYINENSILSVLRDIIFINRCVKTIKLIIDDLRFSGFSGAVFPWSSHFIAGCFPNYCIFSVYSAVIVLVTLLIVHGAVSGGGAAVADAVHYW